MKCNFKVKFGKKVNRPGNISVALGILDSLFSENQSPTLVWYYTKCRANFMSKSILNRFADKIEHDIILNDAE